MRISSARATPVVLTATTMAVSISVWGSGFAYSLARMASPPWGAVGGAAAEAAFERHVGDGVEPRQQQIALVHIGEPAGDRAPVAAFDAGAVAERAEPGDQAQQARLADAARPQEASDRTGLDVDAEIFEEDDVFVSQASAAHADGDRGPRIGGVGR